MRFLSWLYCLIVLGLLVWLGQLVMRGASTDPRALLDDAVRHSGGPELDIRRALSELEQALTAAENVHDDALVEQVLVARAKLLTSTGGLTQARSDLERVLTYYRPRSPAIEAALAEIVLKTGDVEDALARSDAILARDAAQPQAWGVKARALLAIAQGHIDQASRQTGMALAEEGYAKGQALMRQIAALERTDPNRSRLIQQLLDRLPGGARDGTGALLERLDLASDTLSQVPHAIAQSFHGVMDRELVLSYLSLLDDAGREDQAIDFAFAARGLPNVRDWPAFLTHLMHLLLDHGRAELAIELIGPEFGRLAAPDVEFYLAWCNALYSAQRWKGLGPVSNLVRVSGQPEHRAAADFFLGIAQTRQQLYDEAAVTLTRYVKRPSSQPVPGALAIAWQAIGEGYRTRGRFDEERATLIERVRLAPERYDGAGEAWERLSQLWLEARPPNRGAGFEALSHALRLLPARRAELEPRWRELGEQILISNRIDLAAERERLDRSNAALPSSTTNGYHILRHAELLYEGGNSSGAALACLKVLELYPDLLPAIDLYIDASLATGELETAARWLGRHVELAGLDTPTLARMTALPRERLGPEWTLELVRLDPAHTGRRAAADLLREQGRAVEALSYLQLIRGDELDHDGCLLAASLAHELGRTDEAYELLSRLPPELEVLSRALPLALSLGADARDARHLSIWMQMLDQKVEVDANELVTCADRMLLCGLPTSAVELCTLLDARPRWRSAGLFARLAQASLLAGDAEGALDHIERIAAYDSSGSAEIGRLVLAVEARAWNTLPTRIDELSATSFKPDRLCRAALLALSEQQLEARQMIAQGRADEAGEPLWMLLDAAAAALSGQPLQDAELGLDAQGVLYFGVGANRQPTRDPRALLVRLVAFASPDWRAWAVADLQRVEPASPGGMWPNFVAARGYMLLERPEETERLTKTGVKALPTFQPAWNLLEEAIAAQVKRPDHPKLVQLYESRRQALGFSPADRASELLMQARAHERKDHLQAALQAVEAALAIEPDRASALRTRAQLMRRRGEWRAAIDDFHRSLADAPPVSDSHPVAEFLELLDEAALAAPAIAASGAIEREVEFLAKRFELDPLVALRRARMVLPLAKLGEHSARALALDRLAEFRHRTGERALDELRPGSSRAWVTFLSSFDGDRARAFVAAELALQPGSIDLWRMLGHTAAEVGDLDEAIAAFETAQLMLPDGASARRLAELYGDRGDDIAVVRKAVVDAGMFERVKQSDPRLLWTLARALVRGKSADLNEGLGLLSQLWSARQPATEPEAVGRVGATFGIALCRRNQPEDRLRARDVLLEAAPTIADPTRKRMVEALARLAPLFQ